ncbi:MAG: putative hydrolase [Candidatus Tokpelaia sp. JSC188]|nr:MAG: putative hydrolase [Candidatus Tokpelaia sp. JSC188]
MKIAVAQLVVSHDKQRNLDKALTYIVWAKAEKANFIVFPEAFMSLMSINTTIKHADIAESIDGPFVKTLAAAAKKHKIYIIFGIYESKFGEQERSYNTIIFLNDEGQLIHSYRKTHLYDAFCYNESWNIIPGDNGFTPVKTKLGTIGILVCYELRFPEISRTLALQGADILIVPTAWINGVMKEEHLLTLSQARAVENTVFVCIANQVGNDYAGCSSIYNPMGIIMSSKSKDEGLIFADIDIDQIHACREQLPCLRQRLPKLYKLDYD